MARREVKATRCWTISPLEWVFRSLPCPSFRSGKVLIRLIGCRNVTRGEDGHRESDFSAAVVPTTDYAASTWYAPSRIGVKRRVVALSDVIGLDRYWMDGIRMDFGWIGSAWLALLDGLDGL